MPLKLFGGHKSDSYTVNTLTTSSTSESSHVFRSSDNRPAIGIRTDLSHIAEVVKDPVYPTETFQYPHFEPTQSRYGKVLRYSSSFQKFPAVVPHPEANVEVDAQALVAALKNGKDDDITQVIETLTRRSNHQRQEIKHAFNAINDKEFDEALAKKLSGDLEGLMLALVDTPPVYDAKLLQKAMAGIGTDEQTLIDVICTKNNAEIRQLRQTYEQVFNKDLEKQVAGETSGNFKKLLVNLLLANRDESSHVDSDRANEDARILANEKKADDHFADILANQNPFQLQQMFLDYKVIKGEKILEGITSKFSGDFGKAAACIVQCAINKEAYFAEALYNSMKGAGTKESRLNWVIVSRSEIDLINIKMEFEKMYKESVDKWIQGDTSGKYRDALKIMTKSRISDAK